MQQQKKKLFVRVYVCAFAWAYRTKEMGVEKGLEQVVAVGVRSKGRFDVSPLRIFVEHIVQNKLGLP